MPFFILFFLPNMDGWLLALGPSGDYPALIGISVIVLVVDAAAILLFFYAENRILRWREMPGLINEGGLASSCRHAKMQHP